MKIIDAFWCSFCGISKKVWAEQEYLPASMLHEDVGATICYECAVIAIKELAAFRVNRPGIVSGEK